MELEGGVGVGVGGARASGVVGMRLEERRRRRRGWKNRWFPELDCAES